MRYPNGRGIEVPQWAANEILTSQDMSYLAQIPYDSYTSILAAMAEQGKATGSTPDTIINGLTLEWSSAMICNLRAGSAVSFSGNYFNSSGQFGFNVLSGDVFSVIVPVDQSVGFNNGSGQDRIDIIQVRPVFTPWNQNSRQFKDPVSGNITSSLVNTRADITFQFQIVQGTPAGSPVAPTHAAGWIKIAEVYVPASVSAIDQSKIKDVRNSSLWTTEANVTKYKLTHDFGIDWGTGDGQVSALDVPIADAGSLYPSPKNVENALQTIGINIGIVSYTPTGGYTPAVGDVVMELADGTIQKFRKWSASPQTVTDTLYGAMERVCNLPGSNIFIGVYAQSSSVIRAVAFTMSADLVPSVFGSPVTVIGSGTFTDQQLEIVGLDSTHALVLYKSAGGYAQQTAVVITASGTSLSVGTPANNPDATCNAGAICFISSSVVGFATFKLSAGAYYFSGRTISISGSTVTWNSNSDTSSQGASLLAPQGNRGGSSDGGFRYNYVFVNAAGTKMCFVSQYINSGTSSENAWIWNLSGTTVTFVASCQISGGLANNASMPVDSFYYRKSQGVLLNHTMGGDVRNANYGWSGIRLYLPIGGDSTFTGLDLVGIIIPPSYVFSHGATGTASTGLLASSPVTVNLHQFADDCVAVIVSAPTSPNAGQQLIMIEVPVSTPTRWSEPLAVIDGVTPTMCRWNDDVVVIFAWNGSAFTSYAVSRRRRIVGVSIGVNGKTAIEGSIASGLSGLVAGSVYYCSNLGTLTSSPNDCPVGLAVSTTQLLVKIPGAV